MQSFRSRVQRPVSGGGQQEQLAVTASGSGIGSNLLGLEHVLGGPLKFLESRPVSLRSEIRHSENARNGDDHDDDHDHSEAFLYPAEIASSDEEEADSVHQHDSDEDDDHSIADAGDEEKQDDEEEEDLFLSQADHLRSRFHSNASQNQRRLGTEPVESLEHSETHRAEGAGVGGGSGEANLELRRGPRPLYALRALRRSSSSSSSSTSRRASSSGLRRRRSRRAPSAASSSGSFAAVLGDFHEEDLEEAEVLSEGEAEQLLQERPQPVAMPVSVDDVLWGTSNDEDVPRARVVDGESRPRMVLDEMMGLIIPGQKYKTFIRLGDEKGYNLRNSQGMTVLQVKLPRNRRDAAEITNAHWRGIFAMLATRLSDDTFDLLFKDTYGKTFQMRSPVWQSSCFSVKGIMTGTGFGKSLRIEFNGDHCYGRFVQCKIYDSQHSSHVAKITHRAKSVNEEFVGISLEINENVPDDVDLGLVTLLFTGYLMYRRYTDNI